MAQVLNAGLPPGLRLGPGWQVQLVAVDATTGNTVAGVKVSNATLAARNIGGGDVAELSAGAFALVPGPAE